MFFKDLIKKLILPKPFNTGYLERPDGHKIYYHEYGTKGAQPALYFHGGPGGFSHPRHALPFPQKRSHVILFDQRGGGKSEPMFCLKNNTTGHIIDDAKALLDHLGVKKKVVLRGNSYGSTLCLLFAQKFPKLVKSMFLSCLFLARKEDYIEWMDIMANLYPDSRAQINALVPKGKSYFAAFSDMVNSADPKVSTKAAQLHAGYEWSLGNVLPFVPPATPDIMAYAKISLYFEKNHYFIAENQIIQNARKIKDIPTYLIHNRLDLVCAVKQAFDLHAALPKSKLTVVPELGHGGPLLHQAVKEVIEKVF